MKRKIKLTKKEKMIIDNCLKCVGENVTKKYITMLNFETGEFFKVFPYTLSKIREKLK